MQSSESLGQRPDVSGSISMCFSAEELHQVSPMAQTMLTNMLTERLRRQPAPTPAEIQGIKELATSSGAATGLL